MQVLPVLIHICWPYWIACAMMRAAACAPRRAKQYAHAADYLAKAAGRRGEHYLKLGEAEVTALETLLANGLDLDAAKTSDQVRALFGCAKTINTAADVCRCYARHRCFAAHCGTAIYQQNLH